MKVEPALPQSGSMGSELPINEIIEGDCLAVMAALDADSIDAIVTDPPYGLSFMGKDWDHGIPGEHFWAEALRVAKPGAHLLAFGGTRTFHRLACAIEDAGWELRDMLGWIYGSGFPKSLNIGKAIDKAAGAEREVVGRNPNSRENCTKANSLYEPGTVGKTAVITAPATPAAAEWEGWGTALKPAWEPIILARKPLSEPNVSANVLRWGTGGINVDGCRVGTEQTVTRRNGDSGGHGAYGRDTRSFERLNPPGRFPANLIHDGSDEVVGLFPETHGAGAERGKQPQDSPNRPGWGNLGTGPASFRVGDSGSAARFFYAAKSSRKERNQGITGVTLELEICLCGANTEQVASLGRAISASATEADIRGWNMTLCGKTIAGRFRKDIASIMSTATNKTTASKTLTLWALLPTSASIAAVISTLAENGLSLVATVGSIAQSLITMSESPASVRGANPVVSKTPFVISACARPASNFHNTVKPLSLMRYLCRLVTPPGGIVLDPFAGSGSTCIAAKQEGFRFIGIEQNAEYCEIARRRVAEAQNTLFAGATP